MAIKTSNVTVTTTATALLASVDSDGEPGQGLSLLVVSGGPVYVGGPDVTADAAASTGGRPIATSGTFDFDLTSGNDKPYAIVASSTAVLHVFRTGA